MMRATPRRRNGIRGLFFFLRNSRASFIFGGSAGGLKEGGVGDVGGGEAEGDGDWTVDCIGDGIGWSIAGVGGEAWFSW